MLKKNTFKDVAIVFLVTDLARTLAFYRDTVGLSFEGADIESGMLSTHIGETHLVFFVGDAPRGATPQVVFGLAEGGIESVAEELATAGATLLTPVSEAPGGFSVDFGDPDGHVLSLYQDGALPRRLA